MISRNKKKMRTRTIKKRKKQMMKVTVVVMDKQLFPMMMETIKKTSKLKPLLRLKSYSIKYKSSTSKVPIHPMAG